MLFGLCFSTLQSKADDNGEKHVILCRVILGKVEMVNAGSQQCHPSSGEFDTGADDLKNPKWYVVWCTNMNSHILPECVVSFKSSGINGSSCLVWFGFYVSVSFLETDFTLIILRPFVRTGKVSVFQIVFEDE